MKLKFVLNLLLLSMLFTGTSFAAKGEPSRHWDAFLDVGYRFTLLPGDELEDLIKGEGKRYGQSLSQYVAILESQIGGRNAVGTSGDMKFLPPDTFRRVAVAHLILYLKSGKKEHLHKAEKKISVLAGKRKTPRIIFWHNFILAHQNLVKRESLAFTHHVFRIWNDVIMELEKAQSMLGTNIGITGFNTSLPYLYENMVFLILNHGIVEEKLADLHPLGVIIWSMKDRLEKDKGYYQLAESVWNRMYGLTSDNFNVNYAMALLEGETRWLDFEASKSPAAAKKRFQEAENYFQYALKWADTRKGQAAILSRLMESMTKVLNDMVRGRKNVSHEFFREIPDYSLSLTASARTLFLEMSNEDLIHNGGWQVEGFAARDHYIDAMHSIWLNSLQLDILIARYYRRSINNVKKGQEKIHFIDLASQPMFDYLDFFEEFTQNGHTPIVPDNAYFYASYFASELAELHRMKANYTGDVLEYNMAFIRQLQAIEIYPFDVIGVLNLTMQVSQDGTLNKYISNVWPIAERIPESETIKRWQTKNKLPFINEVNSLKYLVPETMRSAPSIIGLQTGGSSRKRLIEDTILLAQLIKLILQSDGAKKINQLMDEISLELNKGLTLKKALERSLPKDMMDKAKPVIALLNSCDYSKLKKALFRNPENEYHALFRSFYHEKDEKELRHMVLLRAYRESWSLQQEMAKKYRKEVK
ncbi:MAG: hypothetical protein OEV42_05695 [Deltaproteobacteria bacterium]|nr:hypothetical protein [Deltaproteobacteria bacterium]